VKTPTVKVPSKGGGELVNSRLISAGPCKLLALIVLNTNAAQQYIQVHESPPALTGDVIPLEIPALPSIPVAAGAVLMLDFGPNGIDLDNCTICNSSTAAGKTLGAADCSIVGVLHG
jgi:hypothetical protein